MKICFYINTLGIGGAERVILSLSENLSNQHGVTVINSYPVEKEYLLNSNVEHVYLQDKRSKENVIVKNFKEVYLLRKVLKDKNPDVIISFMAEPNFRSIIASLGLKTKVIVSVRNDPNYEYGSRIRRILVKLLFNKSDGIVFQTKNAKSWFPKAIQKKSKIIFNPVNDAFINNTYKGVHRDIVSVGRLTKQKNQKLLILSFASIADLIEDDLYIYGDGEMRSELMELIKKLGMENRIFMPGVVSDIASTIRTAKLFVLSSDYEGLPNSLIEAISLGIPCISTDCPCGGPEELLNSDCLVSVGSTDQLSKKILSFVSNEKKLCEESESNVKKAAEFNSNKIFSEWNSYIFNVVNNA